MYHRVCFLVLFLVGVDAGEAVVGAMPSRGQLDKLIAGAKDNLQNGRNDAAIANCNEVLAAQPHNLDALSIRAEAWSNKGETTAEGYDLAARDYQKVIDLQTASGAPTADAANALAWLQATCPEKQVRDGKAAVANATRACELTKYKIPKYLDTLAAAYAEAGDFENALTWQYGAIDLATGNAKLDMQRRVELYEKHQPYHQASNPPASNNPATTGADQRAATTVADKPADKPAETQKAGTPSGGKEPPNAAFEALVKATQYAYGRSSTGALEIIVDNTDDPLVVTGFEQSVLTVIKTGEQKYVGVIGYKAIALDADKAAKPSAALLMQLNKVNNHINPGKFCIASGQQPGIYFESAFWLPTATPETVKLELLNAYLKRGVLRTEIVPHLKDGNDPAE